MKYKIIALDTGVILWVGEKEIVDDVKLFLEKQGYYVRIEQVKS